MRTTILGTITILLIIMTAYVCYPLFTVLPPKVNNVPIYNDVSLQDKLKSVGAIYADKLILQYADTDNEWRGEYGNGFIIMKEGVREDRELATLAHEYLHYIWLEVMTEDKRVELSGKLEALYAQDKDMQKRMQVYKDRGLLSPTELFSIYCTESTDSYMLTIVDECNKYIDRSKLVLTR